MKIVCTPSEYARLIRFCEASQIYAQYPCDRCLMRPFCPDDEGIEYSGLIEITPEEEEPHER